MRRPLRLTGLAVLSAALLVASGGTAAAAPALTSNPDAVGHAAAVTGDQHRQVLDHWTPQRFQAAVPIEALAGDRLADLPHTGTPAAGAPVAVAPTDPLGSGAEIQAFPESGAPWTDGGAVVQTSGRVFFDFQGQPASCSGNAVTSANESVVMTAGHCIKLEGSFHTNWVFVPAYNNGDDPFGTWTGAQSFITPQWNANENINFDIGAMVVNPLGGQQLTDVVGGQGIAFNQPRGLPMYAFGFPAAAPYDGTRLIYCSGDTFNDPLFSTAIGMTCDMTGGSSGGPWFRSFDEATGTGLQNSVNSFKYIFLPNAMFGPYFGTDGQNVYNAAQSA
ncbi:MAG: peptidase [Micromonosporaceae bacterium]|nr:peptidase [Micromonosporaceae bacterium]